MNWNQLSGFIAMLMGLGLAAPLACAGENPPGDQLLQDFSSPPAYSFLSWEGKPKAVELSMTHLFFRWSYDLVTHPAVLDAVEAVLGANVMVWASSIFPSCPRASNSANASLN